MDVGEAFDLISRAIDCGRAAHGYLVVGDVHGNCEELSNRILRKLFRLSGERVDVGGHPDVVMLRPEGRSGIISVGTMREAFLDPMSLSSYSGGWKVGVVQEADRINEQAANAFLKALEEPTDRTLYLLLTDHPDVILPTILSRTQRIDLGVSEMLLDEVSLVEIGEALRAHDVRALTKKLGDLKDGADGETSLVKKRFFLSVMKFARDAMAGGKLSNDQAFRNIDAVEDAFRQSVKAISDEAVLALMMDRMVLS